MTRKQKKILIRIICAVLLLVTAFTVNGGVASLVLFLAAYLVIGYDILIKAVRGIASFQPFDENFLMAVATVGALCLGENAEAAAVMLFYQIGELFQSIALGKSRRSIGALMDLRPDSANVPDGNGGYTAVSPEDVGVGDTVIVLPGERIPLDGVVILGDSAVNTSALTGESVPRSVRAGHAVQSGCVNMTGVIHVRVTKPYGESTASKILDLVENASARKSRSERFITKFARYYTPAVCVAAVALAVFPPLLGIVFHGTGAWSTWIYRGLSFLVISCPCALVISIPLTFFAGIGGAGREGILVKGANYLEALAGVECVVLDKTGTLTEGVFRVTEVYSECLESAELIEYAALAESGSVHPIAKSLRAAAPDGLNGRVENIRETAGKGVCATVNGKSVSVGNAALMAELGIKVTAHGGGTEVFVSVDGVLGGSIVISDVLKPNAAKAVKAMKKAGVRRVAVLTGDGEAAARAVADTVGVDSVKWGLLPDGKVAALEELMDGGKGRTAFAGDGINDAPVIRRADVGIAMGGLGSDAAIEAADVVIMDDDPARIARAILIAKKCMSIVYQNIIFAIGIKLGCMLLGAVGIADMWYAIFADVGVMVLAVLNAVRAMKIKEK
ncbi:MAG: cadmium-translocating P-type ATPase [Clostridia bacterium]|nr:cadmium-translocating P-type ATPase [Clostridia bacterium]